MKYKSPTELPKSDRKQPEAPKNIVLPKASPDSSKADTRANLNTTFGSPNEDK